MILAGSEPFVGPIVTDSRAGDIRSVVGDLFYLACQRDGFVCQLTVNDVTLWPVELQLFRNPLKLALTTFECNESAAIGVEGSAFIKLKTDVVVWRRIFQ